MENSMEFPLKRKNRTTIWSCNLTTGHISGKDKNSHLKRYMSSSVHSSTIYSSQDSKATLMSINRWMDKESVVCLCVFKNWWFQVVVLEKTLESPLSSKEIKPVNPKGNQLWIFTGRTGAEAEAPILWPPDAKRQLFGKDWWWERLRAEEGDRGWDGWIASPTQWTWVWAKSRWWWRIRKPDVLQFMG